MVGEVQSATPTDLAYRPPGGLGPPRMATEDQMEAESDHEIAVEPQASAAVASTTMEDPLDRAAVASSPMMKVRVNSNACYERQIMWLNPARLAAILLSSPSNLQMSHVVHTPCTVPEATPIR